MQSQLIQTANKKVPRIRFSEFSEVWEEKRLEDIGSLKNGINKSKEGFGFGYPFINLMDVFGKPTVSNLQLGLVNANKRELQLYDLRQGDVLFIRSSVKREGVGETSLLLVDFKDTVYSGFLIRFRDERIKIDLNFKKYCFSNMKFRKKLISLSTTSANTNINQESLSSLKVSLPSLAEQHKIASFLSSLDAWIENLRQQKSLLESYKKGMMQKIFSQEIRFKDDNGKDYPGWEEKKLGDFLIQECREVKKPSSKYKAIGIRSHFKGTFQRLDSEPDKIAMDKLFEVKENDLLVNITFAWEGAMAIAKKEDENGLVSHRFPTYTFNKQITSPEYFRFVFPTKKMKYVLENISPGGAGRNRVLNKKDFLKIIINLPTPQEQRKITDFLTSLDRLIESKQQRIFQAEQWKKGLMQQLFI